MSDGIKIFSLETISGDSLLNAYLDVFTRFYPDFDEWFMRKVVPNLGVTREIFLAKIGKDIAGICIKDSYDGYYRLGKKEYAFNGFLEPKKTCRKKIENKDYLGVLL